MAISIWHLYHHKMSYPAFSGMFVDVMPLFDNGSYILIKFLRLIGQNAVLWDQISFFHLNMISSSALIFSEMKCLLSILFSVDERMVILDSYVNDSLSYIVAKRITGRVWNDVFHSTDVSASCRIRNGCTVMSEIAVQSISSKI